MKLLILLIISFSFISCNKDDGDSDSGPAIADQALTGTINGKSFTFAAGSFKDDFFDAEKIQLNLYSVVPTDLCNPTINEGSLKVSTSVKEMVQETSLNVTANNNSQTITLYDYDNGNNLNIVATAGLISITSVDNTTLVGGIVTTEASGSSVNGKFTLTKCP